MNNNLWKGIAIAGMWICVTVAHIASGGIPETVWFLVFGATVMIALFS